jgi:hypothetical protein
MGQTVHHKLGVRLAALAAVTFSLIIVVRHDDRVGMGMAQSTPAFQPQAPIIVARNEPNSPLVISADRQLAKTEQAPEVMFNVTNVTNKIVTAFAIKLDVMADSKVVSTIYLTNLALSATDLPPNGSQGQGVTYENLSNSQHRVTLSLDYLQFSDGKRWGSDSGKSAERVAGQRAAVETLTTRFAGTIRVANANDLPNVLESMTTLEPPPQHSDEWSDGFRSAIRSVTNRLKRANKAGGSGQVNSEFDRLRTKLTGGH